MIKHHECKVNYIIYPISSSLKVMKAKNIPGVPKQIDGAFHDTESQNEFSMSETAEQMYSRLKERFLDLKSWKSYCGEASTDFQLYNASGEYEERDPIVGDYIRIDIPGPGNFETGGYDWVEIIFKSDQFSKDDEMESLLMICRPSKPPHSSINHPAHFYGVETTSSFRISRGDNFIRVGIYGRNEKPNLGHVGFLNKIRHILISIGGFARATKIQWKCLADGLLNFIK